MNSPGARLAAAALYVVLLLGYAYWRSRDVEIPGATVELAIMMVPSLLLGFVVRSWWSLLVPLGVVSLVWVVFEGAGRLGRLDLLAFLLVITVPPAWFAAAIGIFASRLAERYL